METERTGPEAFVALCRRLGSTASRTVVLDQWRDIRKRYQEQHRKYHTLAHINSLLALLDKCQTLADNPDTLEFALWLHDVIYDPRSKTNESDSATYAEKIMTDLGIPKEKIDAVRKRIMATAHFSGTQSAEKDDILIIDLDLAILGSDPADFKEYEDGIAFEYRGIADHASWKKGRIAVLDFFLRQSDEGGIYKLQHFKDHYEHQARENLANAKLHLQASA